MDSEFLSMGERMKAVTEVREKEVTLNQERLELDKEKEKRKQKHLEIEERRMNFDILQTLVAKNTPLTPAEEAYKQELYQLVYGQPMM